MDKRQQFDALVDRGIFEDILPSVEAFKKRVLDDGSFSVYIGIDATADRLHMGHVQQLLILEDLRRMGVRVNLLFGGFTTKIGDPTGRDTARPKLSDTQIRHNIRALVAQAAPFLQFGFFSGARVVNNAEWTRPMRAEKVIEIASAVTIQRLLNRDSFQKRLKKGDPLWVHEVLYPLFQGYDSVAMHIDAELCGTDQLFNALVGRDLVKHYLKKEKFVLTTKLIQDEKTGMLMSKSTGTGVFVDFKKGGEDRMFGAVMSLPDGFIEPLYRGATRVPLEEIKKQIVRCTDGRGAKEVKMDLAEHLVGMVHGIPAAEKTRARFNTQFSEKQSHEHTPEITLSRPTPLVDFLVDVTGVVPSRTRAKHLIREGAVYIDNKKARSLDTVVDPQLHRTVRTGIHMVRVANNQGY